MRSFIVVVIVLSVTVVNEKGLALGDDGCPPWMYRHGSSCECGVTLGQKVKCNITNAELQLQYCLCMTYDNNTSKTIVGYCPYSCVANARQPDVVLTVENVEHNTMCRVWNRQKELCSQCEQGYGVPLYSYDLHCVKCKEFQMKELFKFLAVAFLPLTLMCIIITLFHINILHPPWSAFVLASQVLSAPPVMQGVYSYSKLYGSPHTPLLMFSAFFGPWNLDFFRAVYKPMCISPHIDKLHSFVIEGSIGLYPLVLLSFLYIQLKLHDHGCRVVTAIWKPFHFCISRFRQSLDIKSSLIDTFATFFLLSYMKTGFAAFYILLPTRVWSPNGSHKMFLYYEPSVRYFQDSHIIYGTVTLLLSLIIHLLPLTLLFFYPSRCFQRCLNRLHLRSLALDAFVNAFQGCYKDGTNGTRDCRYFASLHILLRATFVFVFGFTKNPTTYALAEVILLSIYILLFVNVQPYKKRAYNIADSLVIMVLLLLLVFSLLHMISTNYPYMSEFSRVCTYTAFLFFIFYVSFWLFVHIRCVVIRHWKKMQVVDHCTS